MNPRPITIRIIFATSFGKRAVSVVSIIKGRKKAKLVTNP
jgi:hypothetical protein